MCFGLDNSDVSSGIGFRDYSGDYSLLQFGMNVGGYLPIIGVGFATGVIVAPAAPYIAGVGVITALFRIITAEIQGKEIKENGDHLDEEAKIDTLKNHLVRGVAEILCLGPLLLLADIIKTLWEIVTSNACAACCGNCGESLEDLRDRGLNRIMVCGDWLRNKCEDLRQYLIRSQNSRNDCNVDQAISHENSSTSSSEDAPVSNNANLSKPTATPQQSASLPKA